MVFSLLVATARSDQLAVRVQFVLKGINLKNEPRPGAAPGLGSQIRRQGP
jgi:hypothetical protein